MLRKLTPLLIALFALVAGFAAGRLYAPAFQTAKAEDPASGEDGHAREGGHAQSAGGGHAGAQDGAESSAQAGEDNAEFVKLSTPFVIPVIEGGRVTSLVIVSLSIETPAGQTEQVYAREPKLRDGLLQAMFDHANAGGFRGDFTDIAQMNGLRRILLEVAQTALSRDLIHNVLITEILRQDA